MSLLEQALRSIGNWGPKRQQDRTQVLTLFRRIVEQMEGAIKIWKDFLDHSSEERDSYTMVLRMGPERTRKLHALYLQNKATAIALTDLTGVRFKDSLSLAEELDIVQAYEQMRPNETGAERAEAAIRVMTERKKKVEAVLEVLGD
ncbi:MAG TPA: hypothetical protein VIT83_04665 [Gammaproteobacteria bacterium]